MVVIHHTAMPTAEAALERLSSAESGVSSHYVIGIDGTLWRLVPEGLRAWHAGSGSWGGNSDVNSSAIGIELDNPGDHPFAAGQMDMLELLLSDISGRRKIKPERVIGHADMAPERKRDPGSRFDWRRLALRGLSVWPRGADHPPKGPDWSGFRRDAAVFGYPMVSEEALLRAFRDRFRPWASGPLEAADCGIIAELARRWPADGTALRA